MGAGAAARPGRAQSADTVVGWLLAFGAGALHYSAWIAGAIGAIVVLAKHIDRMIG